MRLKSTGMSLATVLMVSALAFTITSVLVAASFFHLNFANRGLNEETARSLAEAAISKALDKLVKDQFYGTAGTPGYTTPIKVTPDWAPQGASGFLAFSPAVGGKDGYSLNNLVNPVQAAGFQSRVVPRRSVHLVATGRCGGVVRRVEAFFHAPPFPYSIASSAPVTSAGNLVVGSLPEGTAATLTSTPAPQDLKPGHLRSNATSGQAVRLGPNTFISGNVEAAGGIDLDSGATVLGMAKSHSGVVQLPELSPLAFDPAGTTPPAPYQTPQPTPHVQTYQTLTQSTWTPPAKLDYCARATGDLDIPGDLTLDGGVLYVCRNLHISGGIKGLGAVVAGGTLTVDQACDFATGNQVALLAEGDITLHGSGTDRSFIQGLIFTHGGFVSSDLTLMGALVKGGDAGAVVDISNSRSVQVPEYTRFVLDPGPPPTDPGPPPTISIQKYNAQNPALIRNYPYGAGTRTDFVGYWVNVSMTKFQDPATGKFDPNLVTLNDILISFEARLYDASGNDIGAEPKVVLPGPQGIAKFGDPRWAAVSGGNLAPGILAQMKQAVTTYGAAAAAWKTYQASGAATYGQAHFRLDLNEFLALGDRMRLLYWEDR